MPDGKCTMESISWQRNEILPRDGLITEPKAMSLLRLR